MKNVKIFQSMHSKTVLIFMLLVLLVMQIIGVYFVRQLETTLKDNFKTSIQDKVNLLSYYIEEQLTKERSEDSPSLEAELRSLLQGEYPTEDILEVKVIDGQGQSLKILGISDTNNQHLVGQKYTDTRIRRVIATGQPDNQEFIDNDNGNRIWVLSTPITKDGQVIAAIDFVTNIESVYKQMRDINQIFVTGTIIALFVTIMVGILLANAITKPIKDMRKQALALSRGNYSRKVKIYGNDEIGQLAYTFNNLTKKLQEAQSTTESERRKLSSVLSYMTDGVIATDRRGRVILINDIAAKMLDVSRETILATPIVELLDLENDYTFEELISETNHILLDYSTQSTPYILRANFSVIQRETGFVNGLIAVLHDVTEQEKIDMERREFVANVSHELRTPLTTMRSYLEALSDGAWKDEEIAPNFLEVTQTETERMIRLVNDLLKLSKLDSKDYKLSKEWVDLTVFYNKIIDRFEMTKEQNVIFERKLPDKAILLEIDPDKITQVLDNIISNALKYSPKGGKVTFRIKEQEDEVILSVTDQGMGIPKGNVEKIFGRFYRVDKARTRKLGGTGLGLAIAKEMVEAHNGRIWARSIEGKGTTIFFSLPYERYEGDEWN
ncbi:cell wall metabolism sensor histidine kinase WalK [Niallia sp. Krafla_26]|uniref:cell wall metabolism sensor histidine kinase WalK n=1 Tax=Niallia sp. Krafla_26 TaxID=3064703 RepID=UPI003D16A5AD